MKFDRENSSKKKKNYNHLMYEMNPPKKSFHFYNSSYQPL
jgi:hypothetical protein